jgi:hypothetical protein
MKDRLLETETFILLVRLVNTVHDVPGFLFG